MLPVSATLRARVALTPRSVVLIDRFGTLTAQELLAQARLHRHRPGSALPGRGHSPWNLLPAHAPLRQIMVTVLASDAPLELRSSGTPEHLSPRRRGPLTPSQFLTLTDLGRRIGLRPGRRVASAAPGVHGHGLLVALGALALGCPLLDLSHRPAAERVDLLHQHPVDLLAGAPVHLVDLMLADRELGGNRPVRIERVISGSDVLSPQLRADLARHFGARVHDIYGTAETGPLAVDGRPLRGIRLRERDGELLARTPFTAGRTYLTDRGGIDADGTVRVTGRAEGVLTQGGMVHDPIAVVRLLRTHPGVTAVQLRVVHDAELGPRTVAEVTLAAGMAADAAPLPEELRALVRDHLGAASVPREVRFSSPGR